MFEVACGNCQGRLMVQQTGVVVACPHCGTHLTIGGPPAPQAPAPQPAPPPQPQFNAPPPQFAPQPPAPQPAPQFQQQPQFAPPPQPQFAPQQPAPQTYQQPAPAPQLAPPPAAPQQFAPPPQQQFAPPVPPAPPASPEVMGWNQPAAPSFEAPAVEAPAFNFEQAQEAAPEEPASWMTASEAAPVAPAAPQPVGWNPAAPQNPPAGDGSGWNAAPQADPNAAGWTTTAPAPAVQQPAWNPAPPTPEAPASWAQPEAAPQQTWGQPEQVQQPAWGQAEPQPTYPTATAEQQPASQPTWNQPAPAPAYPQQPPAPGYQQPPAPTAGYAPQFEQPASVGGWTVPPQPAPQPQPGGWDSAATNQSQPGWPGQAPAAQPDFAANSPYVAAGAAMGASAAASYSTPAPAQTGAPPKPPAMVPKGLFLLVVNYASIMTLAAGYLLFAGGSGGGGSGGGGGSKTDSLPDIEPRLDAKSKKITAIKIPVTQDFIASHQVMAIGETKHFGHFDVTVKKVEHGRIEFGNKDGGTSGLVSPPVEVLKLHVTFKNTSKDQTIAPLRGLAFLQWKEKGERVSNSYFSPLAQRGRGILPYPLDDKVESIKGLNVNQEIKPGESADFFIPTTDLGLGPILKQHSDFVWRVQFRKGYSPKQFGVTTLFEVRFKKDAIEDV